MQGVVRANGNQTSSSNDRIPASVLKTGGLSEWTLYGQRKTGT
jgi:hypothetical protein